MSRPPNQPALRSLPFLPLPAIAASPAMVAARTVERARAAVKGGGETARINSGAPCLATATASGRYSAKASRMAARGPGRDMDGPQHGVPDCGEGARPVADGDTAGVFARGDVAAIARRFSMPRPARENKPVPGVGA